jgi:hypothetical protein
MSDNVIEIYAGTSHDITFTVPAEVPLATFAVELTVSQSPSKSLIKKYNVANGGLVIAGQVVTWKIAPGDFKHFAEALLYQVSFSNGTRVVKTKIKSINVLKSL